MKGLIVLLLMYLMPKSPDNLNEKSYHGNGPQFADFIIEQSPQIT